MKNYVLILTLLLCVNVCKAQLLHRDISFNGNLSTTNTSVRHIAVYADQRILICGDFSNFNGVLHRSLIRLLRNGEFDATFTPPDVNGIVHTIAIQPWDDKILIGGSFTVVNGATRNGLARFNHDGTLDAGFNIGTGIGSGYAGDLNIRSVAVMDDANPVNRRIYAGGQFQTFNGFATGTQGGVVRLHENGSRDAGYNPQVTNGPVYTIKLDASGKLMIGGEFWYIGGAMQVRIARLNTDGTRDATFNTNPFGPYSSVTGIGIDASGRILIGGWFTQFNGVAYNHIVRLNPNGSVDNTFSTGTGLENGLSTFTNGTEARSFACLDDGTIVVGGNFTSYNGTACGNIICLKEDGSLSEWATGTGFNNNIMSLQVQEAVAGEQRILAGGFFNEYQSYAQGTVMRLVPMMSVLQQLPQSHEKISQTRNSPQPGNVSASGSGVATGSGALNGSGSTTLEARAYPVPVGNLLTVATKFNYRSTWSFTAYSVSGQPLQRWSKLIASGVQKSILDVHKITEKYFILIMKNQNQQLQFKVVKQ